MQIKFGTDGWRGRIARDFTFENAAYVMQAFSEVLLANEKQATVYLGYDRRFLSREFAETAASVMTAHGIKVVLATQFCPTPCISWMTKHFKANAGVMITASHNPYYWNGIKFKDSSGGAASPEYTLPIEQRVAQQLAQHTALKQLDLQQARQQGLLSDFNPHEAYVQQLRRMVDVAMIRKAKLNIMADPMFGAGTGFFTAVLEQELTELHAESNPGFNGTQPEPIEKNLPELVQHLKAGGFAIGLSTDGDADRIGAVDEQGRFVDSHHIFALMLRHLVTVRKQRGGVVKTVSTTQMIDRLGEKYGLAVYQTPIGFKHISSKFQEITPLIGGEESGGIAVAEHIPERDGVLSGLMLLEIMAHAGKPLSAILKDLEAEVGQHRFQREDLELSEAQMQSIHQRLPQFAPTQLAGLAVKEAVRLDGCRLNLADGSWVLIRASGTEPLLRLYAEAKSEAQVRELLQAVRSGLGLSEAQK